MKTLIKLSILVFISLIFGGLWSCGIGKVLNQSALLYSEKETVQSRVWTAENEFAENDRAIVLRDSGRDQYQVKIIPIDSFRYSLQDGFHGKALSIELTGSKDRLIRLEEREQSLVNRGSAKNSSLSRETGMVEKEKLKEVKRTFSGIVLVVLSLLC